MPIDSEVRAPLLDHRWRVFSVEATDETRESELRRDEVSIGDSDTWPERGSL